MKNDLKLEKLKIFLQSLFAGVCFILLCIPAFNMTGQIFKPIIISVLGTVVICTGVLFSKQSERVISNGLLILMLFWLLFALLKQLQLQIEAGFVFRWLYFFYYDKLLVVGTIWVTAVLFFMIRRLFLKKPSLEYNYFYKISGRAFLVFYVFLLLFSFVLLRLTKGDHPPDFKPFGVINDYIIQWQSIPYEVFMMVCGNLFYFTPLGYIFSVKFRTYKNRAKYLLYILFPVVSFSLLELSQYIFQNGYCEFDDMMMNSIGFWFGILLCFLTDKMASKISKNRCKTFWCRNILD